MSLTVDVVARDHAIWRGKASAVTVPLQDGELGILSGHVPILSIIGAGEIRMTTEGGDVVRAHIEGGFVSVDEDTVTVIADTGELTSAPGDGDTTEGEDPD